MKVTFKGNQNNIQCYRLQGYDEEHGVYLNGIFDIYENGKIEGPLGKVSNDDLIATIQKYCC